MIHPKYSGLLMSVIISIGMSCVMSFSMTAINFGFVEDFLFIWLKVWGTAFPVALPAALIIVPAGKKLVERLTDPTIEV